MRAMESIVFNVKVLILRQNDIRIEEKERREKEILSQILSEADDYKVDFYNRRKVTCETNRTTNREKEKVNFVRD